MLDLQTPLNLIWRRALPVKDVNTFRIATGRFVVLNSNGQVENITDGVLAPIMKQTFDYLPDNIYESEDVRGGRSVAVVEAAMINPQFKINSDNICLVDGNGDPYVYIHGNQLTVAYKSGVGNQCLAADLGKYVLAQAGDPVYAILDDIITGGIFLIRKIFDNNFEATPEFAPPKFSSVGPVTGSHVKTTDISYTLSEAIVSGSVTFTRTSGAADAASPHVCALEGAELNSGAHTGITLTNDPTLVDGTVYSIAFNGVDAMGNSAKEVVVTGINYDTTVPVISDVAPIDNQDVNSNKVSYTLSEDLASGSVTFTRTGGTADPASPHVCALAGTELDSGIHADITLTNDPTLVDGAIYDVQFDGVDLAGNAATPVVSADVLYDVTVPVISATAPATDAVVTDTKVSFTLSKDVASGSVTFTQTGGTADPASPHVCALSGTELDAGAHAAITLTNDPTLVEDAIYSVEFNAIDSATNPAVPVISTNVTFNAAP